LPKAKVPEAEPNAQLLIDLITKSRDILKDHPINIAREMCDQLPGNLIWLWGGGKKPSMPTLKEKYGISAAAISAVDLVKGIGTYAGMQIINVEGATGLADTNYEGKADAALEALKTNDLVFVHIEAPDEAGHVGDYELKVKAIEDLDQRCIGRIVRGMTEPYAIAILPDHPTPVKTRTHARDPVPFVIAAPNLKSDEQKTYDEFAAKQGGYGLVENEYLISLLVANH
jgi:2,3-bisphosphoglycerate-independent phosphoglycerate mutase